MNKKRIEIEKKGEKSFAFHKRILELKKQGMVVYLELGACFSLVKEHKLYRELGCKTFREYIGTPELGFKLRTAYYLIQIYETFCVRFNVQPVALHEIHWSKLTDILPVVNEQNYLEWLGEAENLSRSDLITKVEEVKEKEEDHEHKWEDEVWERCTVCGKKKKKEL